MLSFSASLLALIGLSIEYWYVNIWWCRDCGYEAASGGRCKYCGGDLAASPLPELEALQDEELSYDLAGWDNPMHVRLIEALIGASVPHRFDDGEGADDVLVVRASDEATVTRITKEVFAAASPGPTSPQR